MRTAHFGREICQLYGVARVATRYERDVAWSILYRARSSQGWPI